MIRKYHGHVPVDIPLPVHHHLGLNYQHFHALVPWIVGISGILGLLLFLTGIGCWFEFLKGRFTRRYEPESLKEFITSDEDGALVVAIMTASMFVSFAALTTLLTKCLLAVLKFFFWV
jgi:hypothetical protein